MNKKNIKNPFHAFLTAFVIYFLVLDFSFSLFLTVFQSVSGSLTPRAAFAASTGEIAILIKKLDSKDIIEQAAAVNELGKAGKQAHAAVRKMAKLLGKSEPLCLTLAYEGRYADFSKLAASDFGRRPFSLSLEVLAALDSLDTNWRGRPDIREAYDMFSADLDSDSPVKRKEAMCAIARFGRPDDAGLIFKLIYDEEGIVRAEAEGQLYRLKPGWREDAVFMTMNSTIITGIPYSRLQKLYKKKLDFNDYFTTAEVVSGDKPIIDYFISNVADESAEIRALSARALGQLRAADSIDLLIAMLGDRDYVTAKSALLSLGRLDEKWNERPAASGAISELKKRFKEIDYDRGMAVYLIQSINTAEAAAALNELFDYCDENLKAQILIGLADMPKGSAGKLVLKRFDGVSSINATYAMDGLKKEYPDWNKDREVVGVIFEKLKPCVTGRDDVARIRSVDILSDIKTPFMRDFFIEAAGDTNEAVRTSAIYGIGRIGDTAAVSILIEMLEDTSEVIRISVSKALDAMDEKWREGTAAVEFAARMQKLAVSKTGNEKMQAVGALGKMKNKKSWDIYLSAADFVDAQKTATAISAMLAADETKTSELVSEKFSKLISRDCKLSVIGSYRENFSPENVSSVKLLAGLWLDDNEDVACTARFAIEGRERLKFSEGAVKEASKIALAAIDTTDARKKIRAIEMCGFFGVEPAFDKIAVSLKDADDKIRYAASEALKGYPKDAAERKVFEIIRSDTSEQTAAYDFLTGSLQDDIFNHLDELLTKSPNDSSLLSKSLDNVDENWKKRDEAAAVFKKIIGCVSDQSLEIRILACKKLAGIARPEAAEELKKALKEKDKRLRDAAGRALASSIRESAVGPLLDVYDDRSLVPEKWSECLYEADKNWTSRNEVFQKIDSLLAAVTTEASVEKKNDIALRLILILKNYNGAVLYEKYRERFSEVSKYFAGRLTSGGDEQKIAYHFIWQTNPVAYHEVALLAESGDRKLREAAARVFEDGSNEAAAGLFPYEDGDRIRLLYLKKDPAGLEKYGKKSVRFLYMLADEEDRLYEKCYDILERLGESPIQRKALKLILSGMNAAPEFVLEKLIVRNSFVLEILKNPAAYFSGLNLRTINEYGGFKKLILGYFNEKTSAADKKAILGSLVKIDKIRTLDMLSGRLGSSDTAETLLAMDGLEFIGRLYNFRPLVNMLEAKDEKIRFRAAALLSKLEFRPFRQRDKKIFDETLKEIEKKAKVNEGGKKK